MEWIENMKETPKIHYIEEVSEFFSEPTISIGVLHFIDLFKDKLRFLVMILCVEKPLHVPVSIYSKETFIKGGYTSLIVFEHVIYTRFIRKQTC